MIFENSVAIKAERVRRAKKTAAPTSLGRAELSGASSFDKALALALALTIIISAKITEATDIKI